MPEGYFGAKGGELVSACLLFDEVITLGDFVEAEAGQWVDERAGSIRC